MMAQDNGNRHLLTLIGTILAAVVSLGVVLGWKFDSTLACQVQEIRKEAEIKYVGKELYTLQVKILDENIRAIGKVVGARMVAN